MEAQMQGVSQSNDAQQLEIDKLKADNADMKSEIEKIKIYRRATSTAPQENNAVT